LHNKVENNVRFVSHNLELPLPFEDQAFDIVICNDVLEHVENKKKLIQELFRQTKQYLIISLPNTQYWKYILGLVLGNMGKQYNFMVEDLSDRHRWITYYDKNIEFIRSNLPENFELIKIVNTVPIPLLPIFLAKLLKKFSVFNQIFFIKRVSF